MSATDMDTDVRSSLDAHFAELVAELRFQAHRQMRGQPANHTLQPTALVNEVYLKLASGGSVRWKSRAKFLMHASYIMRSILIDHARAKAAKKRERPRDYHGAIAYFEDKNVDLLTLDMELSRLHSENPELSKIVELRYFTEATLPEVAEALGISLSSVERRWRFARAYLRGALQ